eukprot:TRINITY_DN13330_c0_g1_i1.p1 TRINITY_DN13330_c0_g1~~TRINITY_DN13330_c0_g1_i1.p1  ORF type:complete len:456 (+),score=79.37 TRINITY_DN13330_c0_g1_i1:153-1520(+)
MCIRDRSFIFGPGSPGVTGDPSRSIAPGYNARRDERRHVPDALSSETTRWYAPCQDDPLIGRPTPAPRSASHSAYHDPPVVWHQLTPEGRAHSIYANQPVGRGHQVPMVGIPTVMDDIVPVGRSLPPTVQHFKGYQSSNQQSPTNVSPVPAPPAISQQQPQQGEGEGEPLAVAPTADDSATTIPDQAKIKELLTEIRHEKCQSSTGESQLPVMAYWARGGRESPYPRRDPASQLDPGSQSQLLPTDPLPEWLTSQRPLHNQPLGHKSALTTLERVKDIFIKTGSIYSGRAMWRTIRNFDMDGNGIIIGGELRAGLDRYGISMDDSEFAELMQYFDSDFDGTIDLVEFMSALRGNLNSMRMKAVERAFDEIDRDHSGEISIHELQSCYDPRVHPDVLLGKIDREQAMELFISTLDPNSDGTITKQEFLNFFADVSLAFDDDQRFLAHVRGMWRRRR